MVKDMSWSNNLTEDEMALNLLIDNTCDNCYYVRNNSFDSLAPSCKHIVRARNIYGIKRINTQEWVDFKDIGVPLPKEKICEYWLSRDC